MSFTPAQELAAQYQSPGPAGIGFARFASSGTVTPGLWKNIAYTETEAQRRPGDPAVEGWADDMVRLRSLLSEQGVEEKTSTCTICHEDIAWDGSEWVHFDGDIYCGTGDGAMALPEGEDAV